MMKWLGYITAGAGAAGVMFTATNYMGVRPYTNGEAAVIEKQVLANTTSILLQRWQYLDAKIRNQLLTPQEKLEYCQISAQLGFQGMGCA
jgi:hypothetical protein